MMRLFRRREASGVIMAGEWPQGMALKYRWVRVDDLLSRPGAIREGIVVIGVQVFQFEGLA
jgi:hypothetical protein